ncbi:hypothetical protein [Sulfurospirillum diekertiae]|uniref:hypothetical protein n=1 Tax=Sulfurospirillum diekertiae TaxID=1854492 RepID=UPI001EE6ACAC|nr:hypothetical protein [Sulfurospirillum diekertiae]
MAQNSFLRWLGCGILALILWLFFPFLKSFFVALLMAMAVSPLHHLLERFLSKYDVLKKSASVLSASIVTFSFFTDYFCADYTFFIQSSQSSL